jgi:hypothetical protein
MANHIISVDDETFKELKRIVSQLKKEYPQFKNLITNNFVIANGLNADIGKIVLKVKKG